jgi:hypothetical protein
MAPLDRRPEIALAQIAREPLKRRDLERAAQIIGRWQSWHGGCSIGRFPFLDQNIVMTAMRGRWSPEKVMAIVLRLQAMAAQLERPSLRGWSVALPGEVGNRVHRAVIEAATSATLLIESRPRFDNEEFDRLVAAAAAARGAQ